MAYFNKFWELMDRDQLKEVQLKKFQKQVHRMYGNTFYKKRFGETGVTPDDIKNWDDIKKVPFTHKHDLHVNYPLGLLIGDWEDVVRIHMTSGTTGTPTPMVYTQGDVNVWAECMARSLVAGGLKKSDVVQQAYGLGLFTGGLGFHYGLECVGAKVIPTGSGGTDRQLRLMQEWGTTVFTSTPTYAAYVAEIAREKGIDPVKDLKLRLGFHGGEPVSDELRKRIDEGIGYKAHGGGMRTCYGLTEMGGPIGMDCENTSGIHLWGDHFLVEVLDPETLRDVQAGRVGELVITNLSFEAMPILRYRTGDRVAISFDTCDCGRTHPRITSFLGRIDDMLLVSGTNVYPSQVEYILLQHPGMSENWQLIVGDKKGLHTLRVEVEPAQGARIDRAFIDKLEKELYSHLEITCRVEIKPIGTLPRFQGKAVRVRDERV